MKRTYSAKPADISRTWYIIDASEASLGRTSTLAAELLLGKRKTIFSPNIDCGDHVIIINASKLVVTGNKLLDKKYYRHSGHPGNLRTISLGEQIEKNPIKAVQHAIRGMVPANRLRKDRLARLRIFADESHEHEAQQPVKISAGGTK